MASKVTVKQVGAGVAATVGVLASLVGVLSYIDQKRMAPPPAASRMLAIQSVALRNRAEQLRDFLANETPNSVGRSYTEAELQRRGLFFQLHLYSENPVGTRLRLHWRLRIAGGDPLPGPDYNQLASDFKTSALKQGTDVPVWVPEPRTAGRYVVSFTLDRLDPQGRVVSFATEVDSEQFTYAPS